MQKRVSSRTRSPSKRTSEFSTVSDGGMFQSRPFVMQSKVGEEREKSGLKTSLVQAERYGHHLDRIQSADVSPSQTVQPERLQAPPVQLVKETRVRSLRKTDNRYSPYKRMTNRERAKAGATSSDSGRAQQPQQTSDQRDLWNEQTRPSFTQETLDAMLKNVSSKKGDNGVTLYQCQKTQEFLPLKRDTQKNQPYITLDHKIDWKKYILENARPEADGKISKDAAKEAYNNIENLVVMGNSPNSSKNAPKGVFD